MGRQRSKDEQEFGTESVLLLLSSVGDVPEWEGGNHFWTEMEQEMQFARQLESDAASIWKYSWRLNRFWPSKEQ